MKKFLIIEPKLFEIILRTIYENNERYESNLQVAADFFSTYFNQLGDDIEFIKKAYLQQIKIQNRFEIDLKGFLKILIIDPHFLQQYVNELFSENQFRFSIDLDDLSFIWHVKNIEPVLKSVFDLIVEREPYHGISEHFCNSFFRNLKGEARERAKLFVIDYCKASFLSSDKMNVIVDIARHSIKESLEEILLLFLSLTQDKEIFSEIWWRGNGTGSSSGAILADIEMADWRNILSIVEKSSIGIKLIPIKSYLNEQIENCRLSGDYERQRRFLSNY